MTRGLLSPARPVRDLTIPEPGSTTAREVLSLALRRLLQDALDLPRTAPPKRQKEAARIRAVVENTMRANPGALFSALRRPVIGTLIRCLRPECGLGEDLREAVIAELLASLEIDLALSGAKLPPRDVDLAEPRRVLSLMDRSARDTKSASVAHPYRPIARNIVLALADNNPLSMEEAHPDKEGNAIDLGGHPESEWVETLKNALSLIDEHLPDLSSEIDLFIHQIVPVGYDDHKHLSASYQEAIGTIYMTLHPSLMTMTEAVIHEFSHNKINALFELDGVLENAWSPLYTSPVRPDPRPLHGVLLAVHAFLPVARLYEKMAALGHPLAASAGFKQRFEKIRSTNREGAEVVLKHGKPTQVGRPLLEEIAKWDAYYADWPRNAESAIR